MILLGYLYRQMLGSKEDRANQ